MPRIKVLFFARARELAGTDQAELELADGVNSDDLLHLLLDKYPGLQVRNKEMNLSTEPSAANCINPCITLSRRKLKSPQC